MPDNIPASLRTGIDPSTEYALKLDTQNRLKQLSSVGAPPAIELPQYTLPQIAEGKAAADPAFNIHEAIFSDDPDKQALADQIIKKGIQNDIAFTQGIGIPNIYDYDKSMDKYLEKDLGYNPEKGVALNEDYYYRNVGNGGFFGAAGTFLGRAVATAATKLGSAVGTTVAMVNPINIFSGDWSTAVADNALSRFFDSAEAEFKEQWLPVYKSIDYDNKGIFSKMGTAEFWSNNVADGVAFMLSAAVPGIGLAGRGAKITNSIIKGVAGIDSVGTAAAIALNTANESFVEARGVYDSYRQKAIDERNAGGEFKTDRQIDEEAGKLAADTFKGNLAVLLGPSIFENAFVFNKFRKGMSTAEGLPGSGINIGADLKASAKNAFSATKWGKQIGTGSRLNYYGKRGIAAFGMEGLWEENAQLAVQRINSGERESGFTPFWNQYFDQTINAFSGRDGEAAEGIALGAIIGVGGTTLGAWKSGERKKLRDSIKADISNADALNLSRNTWLTVNDLYEKDADGKVLFNKRGDPIIKDESVILKAAAYSALSDSMESADNIQNPALRSFASKEIFKEFVAAHVDSGTADKLLNRLTNFSDRSKEEIATFGFDPNTIKYNPQDLAEYARKLVDIKTRINQMNLPPMIQQELYARQGQNINLEGYEKDLFAELEGYKSNVRTLDTANTGDTFADQHNMLQFRIKGLQQMNEEKPSPYYAQKIQELQEEQDELNARFGDLFERDSFDNTPDGYLLNKKYKPSVYVESFYNSQRKIAEVQNMLDENNYYSDRLQNPETSIDTMVGIVEEKLANTVAKDPVGPQGPQAIEEQETVEIPELNDALIGRKVVDSGSGEEYEITGYSPEKGTVSFTTEKGIKGTWKKDKFDSFFETGKAKLKDEITAQEFQEFVDTGVASEKAVDSVANKIAKGEKLSQQEEAVRQANAESVETKLRKKAEKKEKANPKVSENTKPPKTNAEVAEGDSVTLSHNGKATQAKVTKVNRKEDGTIESVDYEVNGETGTSAVFVSPMTGKLPGGRKPDVPDKVNYEYTGRKAYLTALKSTLQEVDISQGDEVVTLDEYQAWAQDYLTQRMATDLGLLGTAKYKMMYMPDRPEWDYNKSKGYDGLLGAVFVITDNEGSPVYFDKNWTPTTQENGRVISYVADLRYADKDLLLKSKIGAEKGILINGKLTILSNATAVAAEHVKNNKELVERRNQIVNTQTPQEVVVTTIQANNEVKTGPARPTKEVFGDNPDMYILKDRLIMLAGGHPHVVEPMEFRSLTSISKTIKGLLNASFSSAEDANDAIRYLHTILPPGFRFVFSEGKINAFYLRAPVNTSEFFDILHKVKNPVKLRVVNQNINSTFVDFSADLKKTTKTYGEFLKDNFTTKLVGIPTKDGGVSYRPPNAYFTFEFADKIDAPVTNEEAITPIVTPQTVGTAPAAKQDEIDRMVTAGAVEYIDEQTGQPC